MELEAVARVRGHERAPTAVLLHAQLANLRACQRRNEIVLVEHKPQMVDAWQLPLAGLDDDVDRAALQLREPELEAHPVEVIPAVARLEGRRLLPDAPMTRDERETELSHVARLDLTHLARHQVVMEEVHEGRLVP